MTNGSPCVVSALPGKQCHLTSSSQVGSLRSVYLFLGVLMLLGMTGCKPMTPEAIEKELKAQQARLQGVVLVEQPKHKPSAYRTTMIEGVEVLVSPYAVGQFGGIFRTSQMGNGPQTFNPWASYDATSSGIGGMFFPGLTTTNVFTGEETTYLAKHVEIKPNHTQYIVTLRKGLKWSDGHPLTVDDVVFTWNEIMAKGLGNPSTRDNLLVDGEFPKVTKLDAYRVEFTTKKPFVPFKAALGNSIAPKHIVAPILKAKGVRGFTSLWNPESMAKHPETMVSAGLWKLSSYKHGRELIVERNPYSFIVDREYQALPYLDQYLVKFVKDQNAELLLFEQGQLDTLDVKASTLSRVRQIKSFPLKLYDLGPTSASSFITFNQTQKLDATTKKPLVDPVHQTWFQSKVFRQAMDWAIDRDKLVRNVLRGIGSPLFTPEPINGVFVHPTLVKGHRYNPQYAKALLEKAGFTWRTDGQCLDPQKHPVRFTLMTNSGNEEREATLVSIQQDFAKLGIKVDLRPMDFNMLVGRINSANWESIMLSLTGSPLEPNGGRNVMRSDGALHIFHQRFPAKFPQDPDTYNPPPTAWEAQLNALFDVGAKTFDLQKRKAIYHAYQTIIAEEQPFVYLYSPRTFMAVRRRVRNFMPTPLGTFHNMESIWLQERITLPEGVQVEGFDPNADDV
ncbi:MAG: ABC transporter substrate-binding protein [Vampirovibrionales bacterium]